MRSATDRRPHADIEEAHRTWRCPSGQYRRSHRPVARFDPEKERITRTPGKQHAHAYVSRGWTLGHSARSMDNHAQDHLPITIHATRIITALLLAGQTTGWADPPEVDFDTSKPGQVAMAVGGHPVAVYVYEEKGARLLVPISPMCVFLAAFKSLAITPPSKARICPIMAPITRESGCRSGTSAAPITGALAARTEQAKFVEPPTSEPGRGPLPC